MLLHYFITRPPWVSRKYCNRWGPRKWHHMNKDHLAPSYCLVAVILQQWYHFLGPHRVQYFLLTWGEMFWMTPTWMQKCLVGSWWVTTAMKCRWAVTIAVIQAIFIKIHSLFWVTICSYWSGRNVAMLWVNASPIRVIAPALWAVSRRALWISSWQLEAGKYIVMIAQGANISANATLVRSWSGGVNLKNRDFKTYSRMASIKKWAY